MIIQKLKDFIWMKQLVVDVESGQFREDQRELDIIAKWRDGELNSTQARNELGDLTIIQMEESWVELQEEFKDDPETLRFMEDYGYVPFEFELEEWRKDADYPFTDEQVKEFIKAREAYIDPNPDGDYTVITMPLSPWSLRGLLRLWR